MVHDVWYLSFKNKGRIMKNNINNFVYIVPFNIMKPGGKSLGSRSKFKSLSKYFNVKLISPNYENIFYIAFFVLYAEVYMLALGLFCRSKKNIFFTRGVVGIFATYLLKKTSNSIIVREIHAAPGEYKVLKKNPVKKFLVFIYEKISFFIDSSADFRVYNHPNLYRFYSNASVTCSYDMVLYNGASMTDVSMKKNEARSSLKLDHDKILLVFTGSVSSWHNIEHLIRLQNKFDIKKDQIQIVVGGGRIPKNLKHNIINIFPLNEIGCQKLILAADACLLPLNDNRVSPGSPLKLYQYLLASKPVITQLNVTGYSDEVLKYKGGIALDFNKTDEARLIIINFINNELASTSIYLNENKSKMNITWDDRMKDLSIAILSHPKIKNNHK